MPSYEFNARGHPGRRHRPPLARPRSRSPSRTVSRAPRAASLDAGRTGRRAHRPLSVPLLPPDRRRGGRHLDRSADLRGEQSPARLARRLPVLSYSLRPILEERMPVLRMPREEAVQLADAIESFYVDPRSPRTRSPGGRRRTPTRPRGRGSTSSLGLPRLPHRRIVGRLLRSAADGHRQAAQDAAGSTRG